MSFHDCWGELDTGKCLKKKYLAAQICILREPVSRYSSANLNILRRHSTRGTFQLTHWDTLKLSFSLWICNKTAGGWDSFAAFICLHPCLAELWHTGCVQLRADMWDGLLSAWFSLPGGSLAPITLPCVFTFGLLLNCKLFSLSPHVPSLKSSAPDQQAFWQRCFYASWSYGSHVSASLPQRGIRGHESQSTAWNTHCRAGCWFSTCLLSYPDLPRHQWEQGNHHLGSHVLCSPSYGVMLKWYLSISF